MTSQQMEQLADELLRVDIDQPSAVLSALSDDELQSAFDNTLKQFGLELAIGVCDASEWMGGTLVIDANRGAIHFLQTAFHAIRLEIQQRQAVRNS